MHVHVDRMKKTDYNHTLPSEYNKGESVDSICEKHVLKIRALIFDMDGVITDTMPYHYQAWKIAFQDILQKDISEQDIYLREGSKGAFALQEIFQQYGWPCDPDILAALLKRKEEVFPKIVHIDFVDGSLDFLKKVHAQGFRMALVTGTSREELSRMLPDFVQTYFSVIVTGSDVAHGKPHPEPYEKALSALRLNPGEAAVLENAPLGVQSAKSAGLICIALATSLTGEFLTDADFVFSSYNDMVREITFINDVE
jgi:HAD superfamily hydrolase (TIGR01509 family)